MRRTGGRRQGSIFGSFVGWSGKLGTFTVRTGGCTGRDARTVNGQRKSDRRRDQVVLDTAPARPTKCISSAPLSSMVKIFAVLSFEQVARYLPHGEKRTDTK